DRSELILVDDAEPLRDTHQRRIACLEREDAVPPDPIQLEQCAMRRRAVMQPRRDDCEVERVVLVGERFRVLTLVTVAREVRERDVCEAARRERLAVDRAAGDHQHAPVPLDETLLDELTKHALVEPDPLGHRLPNLPRLASRQPLTAARTPAASRALARCAPSTTPRRTAAAGL